MEYYHYLCLFLISTIPVLGELYEGDQSDLGCGYNSYVASAEKASVIFWTVQNATSPLAELDLNMSKLKVNDKRFMGRVEINPTNGDLTIEELDRQDTGTYVCSTVVQGSIIEREKHSVDIYVKPKAALKCSKDPHSFPGEPCTSFEDDEIESGACHVTSKPKATVGWLEDTSVCGSGYKAVESCETDRDGISICTSVLMNVCPGTYTCVVTYLDRVVPHMEGNEFTKAGPASNKGTLIGIVCGVVAGICLIIAAAIGIFCIIKRYQAEKTHETDGQADDKESKPLTTADEDRKDQGENGIKDDEVSGEKVNEKAVVPSKKKLPKQMTQRSQKYFEAVQSPDFKGKAIYRSKDQDGAECMMQFEYFPQDVKTQPAIEEEEEPSSPVIEEV